LRAYLLAARTDKKSSLEFFFERGFFFFLPLWGPAMESLGTGDARGLFTFLPFYPFTFLPFYPFTFLPFYPFTFLPLNSPFTLSFLR
jgi:hypothetical protein